MLRRIVSFIASSLLTLEMIVAPLPVAAEPDAVKLAVVSEIGPPPISSKTLVLDPKNPDVTVDGLELSLPPHYDGGVAVRVDCYAADGTPALSVDRSAYGPESRLLNLTRSSVSVCSSYGVAILVADAAGALLNPAGGSNPSPTIGVSVHIAGSQLNADSVGDMGVFVFNSVSGNWSKAQPFAASSAKPQRVYATLGQNFQKIIGGVIAIPKPLDAQAAANSPSALAQPLEQVNPASGYLSIDNVEPDSKGSFGVNLPLLLRPSRGPGPSFSVGYSPQGGIGALGRGWDLRTSSIEVRGPAPIYHPGYETEDYTLDGQDLIAMDEAGRDVPSLYKGGPIVPRIKGMRVYHLRNNSSGLIVRRYGDGPNDYFWEAWDPNAHTTRLYGGVFAGEASPPQISGGNGLLRATVITGSGKQQSVIGQWELTQEFDSQTARTGASYEYIQSNKDVAMCVGLQQEDCQGGLMLSKVQYNLAFGLAGGAPLGGITTVDFGWTTRAPEYVTTDGRLGFFRAQSYWLKNITVRYTPDVMPEWAKVQPDVPSRDILFARHEFELTTSNCVNFEQVLSSYTVEANSDYDLVTPQGQPPAVPDPLVKQEFHFAYEGEKLRPAGTDGVPSKADCAAAEWQPHDLSLDAQGTLAGAKHGSLGFPADLLEGLNIGLLAGHSLIGSGQSSQTGASLYVGVGPVGSPSEKRATVGFKAGVQFTRSAGDSTLVDVTGDGIADIVFRQPEGARTKLGYCAGIRAGDGTVSYPDDRCGDIEGVNEFASSSSSTLSVGVEGYGAAGFGGVGYNGGSNETQTYLVDRDGDGLIDVAVNGQVYYGQGERVAGGRRIVQFLPDSALFPPIPQAGTQAARDAATAHVPADLRATITDIEGKLEVLSQRLARLDYSQTTLAWEAPLDGQITIAGIFKKGETQPDGLNAGAYDLDFTPAKFKELFAEVSQFEQSYITRKENCELWPEQTHCHAPASDPLDAVYGVVHRVIGFIETHTPKVEVSLFRKEQGDVVSCSGDDFDKSEFKLDVLTFGRDCRGDADASKITVKTGDVLYVTYSVDPHLSAFVTPDVSVAYSQVESDPVFALASQGGHDALLAALPCVWKEQVRTGSPNCLAAKQTRYGYQLTTGTLTTAPNRSIVVPPADQRAGGVADRLIEGRFTIPTDLTRDYQVYFDVMAASIPGDTVSAGASELSAVQLPATALPRAYRQDVTLGCARQTGPSCVVDVDVCPAPAAALECGVLGKAGDTFAVATRLVVEQIVSTDRADRELPAHNIDARLSELRWLAAPLILSVLKEVVTDPSASVGPQKPVRIYLPVAMGEPDTEHVRVVKGVFDNPDAGLADDVPENPKVDLAHMLELERTSEGLARARQTLALCAYEAEILDFLRGRYSTQAPPFAGDYSDYWDQRNQKHKSDCDDAQDKFNEAMFTGNDRPETLAPKDQDILRLPEVLGGLAYAEQITSAETLLERVYATLDLGPELLMDDPRVTRRGYRLPVKVNPFNCNDLAVEAAPLPEPIVGGAAGDCAYRLSTNFAMQDFDELVSDAEAKSIHTLMAQFRSSKAPAFRIDMTATINGRPVAFRKLSGEDTGNQQCTVTTIVKTCIGAYGTIGPDAYFHPIGDSTLPRLLMSSVASGSEGAVGTLLGSGLPYHGDVFQRITANKRIGRAVAFQNNIMDDGTRAICEQQFPIYSLDLAPMEAKQDCSFAGNELTTDEKYANQGEPIYSVPYTIGEDNQFVGRNWVLEFHAKPLDLLELHFHLSPVENTVKANGVELRGDFSVFSPTLKIGGATGETFLMPRSPSQILPGAPQLKCPLTKTLFNKIVVEGDLLDTCRPFTQLAWTEVFLGAQYRTYNEAQATDAQRADKKITYSIKRRRDMMRLQPEIEVSSEQFHLEMLDPSATSPQLLSSASAVVTSILDRIKGVGVGETPKHLLVYLDHDPAVAKTGGDWAFFAGRIKQLARPHELARPPTFPNLRYVETQPSPASEQPTLDQAHKDCGTAAAPNLGGCAKAMDGKGEDVLALRGVAFFGLQHQFLGPVSSATLTTAHSGGACVAELPTAVASCWKGVDDSVSLELAVTDGGPPPRLASISAMVGYERPPIVAFKTEFYAYRELVCLDQALVGSGLCTSTAPPPTNVAAAEPEFPNRPTPPSDGRIPIYAPIQTSSVQSVSLNGGSDISHGNVSVSEQQIGRMLQDVNGDGVPDVISGGVAELSSPVGLSRSDWWRYFVLGRQTASLGTELSSAGLGTSNSSWTAGAGLGTAASFAVYTHGGPSPHTESPNANVNLSVSINLQAGHDTLATELIDLNGDGIADLVDLQPGGNVGVSLSAGNRLRSVHSLLPATGSPAFFNSNQSIALGIRLGYTAASDSNGGGIGLEAREAGSQGILTDFTGDQLPDLVVPDGGVINVYPNLGSGFSQTPIKYPLAGDKVPWSSSSETALVDAGGYFTMGFNFTYVRVVFTPGVEWGRGQSRDLISLRDMNGDGVPDIATVDGDIPGLVHLSGDPVAHIQYNPTARNHLLAGITNPSGSQLVLKYGLFGNSGPEHGLPVWALTDVARYDGFDSTSSTVGPLPDDGQDVLLATYSYDEGHYNRAERQFYGFAKRTSIMYGCDGPACLAKDFTAHDDTPDRLAAAGYVALQRIDERFANNDFFTQGLPLVQVASGVDSSLHSRPSLAPPDWQTVSRQVSGYSIDNLEHGPSQAVTGSVLPPLWTKGSTPNRTVFGSNGWCRVLFGCEDALAIGVRLDGFDREQQSFWGQQSAAVRQRLTKLETFANGGPPLAIGWRPLVPRLRSAVAFDHDQWGQVLGFDNLGEASPAWVPSRDASVTASVSYTPLDGLNHWWKDKRAYPLLGLAHSLEVMAGTSDEPSPQMLRAREADYDDDGHGNLAALCLYPQKAGFTFRDGICGDFRTHLQDALKTGYATPQAALRTAYEQTAGLPKGQSTFGAVVLHQLVGYDDYGNLTHAISPLSDNKEWIERRFSYGGDPFRRTATSTSITRCVDDVAGAGTDSVKLPEFGEPACGFGLGLSALPDLVHRRAITHASFASVEPHFGAVSLTSDINGNSLLFDFDRWGRLALLARSWGKPPRENKTFADELSLAMEKQIAANVAAMPAVDDWRILARAQYGRQSGALRSNLLRYESADSYGGLLSSNNTARETAAFADGLGRPIQTIREADVCMGIRPEFLAGNVSDASATLEQRCKTVATGVVTPADATDALGRDWASYEAYPIDAKSAPRTGRTVRFDHIIADLAAASEPVSSTRYDGGGRPTQVDSRLSDNGTVLKGSAQFAYRVVPERAERGARFEALSLSPRCTATATWSDARGLARTMFEDQIQFYRAESAAPTVPAAGAVYGRDPKIVDTCLGIADIAGKWTAEAAEAEQADAQPARVDYAYERVDYAYDPLAQMTGVSYPLDGAARGAISVGFDQLGRTTSINDPDSGCTAYAYDGLNALMSQSGFRFEEKNADCGTTSKVANSKTYKYSGGRLLEMSYRSLEEQGGPPDVADTVRFFLDRYPFALKSGEIIETPRFVPNDLANERFIDVTGRTCQNCIGQVTLVSDRSGARSFAYDELGLPKRELRSIVAPVTEVKQSEGQGEVYLPEVAFYELENSYTAFGDPIQEEFSESAPSNPALKCIAAGVDTCLARFSIGRKYTPDGAVAETLFNGKPLIRAAQDALGRPAIRWTADGTTTGYSYDPLDLRLDQMSTLTAAADPVQVNGYQYDGGGNILGYTNSALAARQGYASRFTFLYDAANRLGNFDGEVSKTSIGTMGAAGVYTYDAGHRFATRSLAITEAGAAPFKRDWTYKYGDAIGAPLHAPQSIDFAVNGAMSNTPLGYDDLGRMIAVGPNGTAGKGGTPLLSNRAIAWDAEGRPIRVRGVADPAVADNANWLREDYVYDFGGNRTLKIDHPRDATGKPMLVKDGDTAPIEVATIYMTPFYARPYDGHGTVELSQGSLPTASLSPPANESEDPLVTYLYSDLPVGSMTASVTTYGEPAMAGSSVIARREYEPYGLELTNDSLAKARDGVPPMSAFQGKELDLVTGFSSFGARSYSQDLGIWLSPDPMLASYLSGGSTVDGSKLSSFAFDAYDPIMNRDPDGRYVRGSYDKTTGELKIVDMDIYRKGLPNVDVDYKNYKKGGIRTSWGELTSNQTLVIKDVFSGGFSNEKGIYRNKADQIALPNGTFDLLGTVEGHDDWYRLDARDSEPYNDRYDVPGVVGPDGKPRSGFRFHEGTLSHGCITICRLRNPGAFAVVDSILKSTSFSLAPRREGNQKWNPLTWTRSLGTMTVGGTDSVPAYPTPVPADSPVPTSLP